MKLELVKTKLKKLENILKKEFLLKNKKPIIAGAAVIFAVLVALIVYLNSGSTDEPPKNPILDASVYGASVHYKQKNSKILIVSFKNSGSPVNIKNAAKKNIASYVKINPTIKGDWQWSGKNSLMLKAKEEFRSGTKYKVKISKEFFDKKIELKKREVELTTPKLACLIAQNKFYINPTNSRDARITAKVQCNYPLDANSINDGGISLDVNKSNIGLKLDLERKTKTIIVTSDVVKIDGREHYANLKIDNNLKDVYGIGVADKVKQQIKVPSISSIFKVNNISTRIVRKNDDLKTPSQVLIIDTSLPVKSDLLAQNLESYLLPDNQYWNLQKLNKNKTAILQKSQKVDLQQLPAQRKYNNINSFSYNIVPKERQQLFLYVKINAGLQTDNGYKISKTQERVFMVPKYPKEIKVIGQGSVLNLKGDKKLSYFSRGVKKVKISVKRLLPGQINHLVTQTGGNIKNLGFKNYNFNPNNITQAFEESREFVDYDPQKINYSYIDFAKYIKKGQGIFILDLQSEQSYSARDKRFVIVTDIGILAKKGADNSGDLFITSLSKEAPIKNAKVEVLGKNGLPIITKLSDKNGHVQFPDLRSYKNEKEPVAYLVTKGNDISFLPYDNYHNLNYSSFDVGGQHIRHINKDQIKAFIFNDRGIYRPGNKVNIAAIVKRRDFEPLHNTALEVDIVNPKNKTVFTKSFNLPRGGIFDFNYETNYGSLTGNYRSNIYLVKWHNNHKSRTLLGSKGFLVEEFQPDKVKIKSDILLVRDKGWSLLKNLQAKVRIDNLFGLPNPGNLVKADVKISPVDFYDRKYRDYTFKNPLRLTKDYTNKSINKKLKPKKTDENGEAIFDLNVDDIKKGFYRLSFLSEGFDDSDGKSVKARNHVYIASYANLIGYKADGNLNYIKKGSSRAIKFIAIDNLAKQVDLNNLTLKTFERKNTSTLIKDKYGRYSYQSIESKELLNKKDFKVLAAGSKYKIPSNKSGKYSLVIEDEKSEVLTNIDYFIAGGSNITFDLEHNNNLQVRLNKEEYKNGESIELNITAPYKGYGLITIEKDKVYAHKWFRTNKNSTVQSIRIPKDLESNAYVNVSFVRSAKSKEVYTKPLSYAAIPFNINKSKRQIKIDFDVNEVNKPNQEIKVKYKTSKPAKIIVFGVDAGILQVAKYQVPDPLGFFLKKQALEVSTSQILDLILPEYSVIKSVSSPSGGMRAMAKMSLKRNLNPFKRKELAPMVFWSKVLDSDKNYKEVKFKAPSYFNGQIKIMAVAVNDVAIGSKSTDIIVRAPIIIAPSMPTNIVPGDEFDINVSLTNNIDNPRVDDEIIVTIEDDTRIKIIGAKKHKVTIKKKSEKRVVFKAKALDSLGASEIKIKASLADKSNASSYDYSVSVRPKNLYKTSIKSDVVGKGKASIEATRNMHSELSDVNLSISNNPIIFARNLGKFLQDYPYSCSEQITSRLFSFITLIKFGNQFLDFNEARNVYNQTIDQLRARQNASGGISLWPGNSVDDEFATIYVAHLLTEAKELYYPVPRGMKSDLLSWLETYLERDPHSLGQARLQSYAAYILTRNGRIVTPELVELEKYLKKNFAKEFKNDISAAYIASSYKLLKDNSGAQRLIANYSFPSKSYHKGYIYYKNSLAYDAQYLYMLAKHFPNRVKRINADEIKQFIAPIFKQQYNSLAAGYSVLALSSYQNDKIDTIDLNVQAKDKNQKDVKVDSSNSLDIVLNSEVKNITFDNSTDSLLFYSLLSKGFDKGDYVNKDAEDLNIPISKDYLNEKGDVVSEVQVGDELEVQIQIKLFNTDNIYSSVIVDLLPGGFEVVPGSIKVNNMSFYEKREDRNIFFTSLDNRSAKQITYKIKAINSGTFNIPATFASDMYDNSTNGRSNANKTIIVKPFNNSK